MTNGFLGYRTREPRPRWQPESTVWPPEISAILRGGVWELRIDTGPGYRVYHAMAGRACVLLLCGGDKRKQSRDISRALELWRDYKERTGLDET